MIRLTAICALTLLAAAAEARTYGVRSGEHADFSRVLIEFDDVPAWKLGRVDGGYEFRPAEDTADYDLSSVFDLIPRDRVRRVESRSDGRLFLAVDCECHVEAFVVPSAGLVIDVKSGAGPADSPFELALDAPEPMAEDRAANSEMPGTLADNPLLTTPTNELAERFLGPVLTPPDRETPVGPAMASLAPEMSEAGSTRVADIQKALIEQLGRAASQGLVTADLSETEARIDSTHPMPDAPHTEAEVPRDLAGQIEDLAGPHVRVETAVDRGSAAIAAPLPITDEGANCLASEIFDLATWGSEMKPGAPTALSRSSIVGEFDAADPKSVEALAKHYIYLTFGAEAKALVRTFDTAIQHKAILLTIADIMDYGMAQNSALGSDQMTCESATAMWALLASDTLTPGTQVSTRAILASFAELPLHLRRHLGRYLAERFLEIDDIETAATIRDAIARAPGDHGESFDLMEAQIALELGHEDDGMQQLDEITAADGPLAPEAIIHRVDSSIEMGKPLPPNIAETTAALAYEANGTEMGGELLRAHLRAVAHNGDILEALNQTRAAHHDHRLDDTTKAALLQEIYGLAVTTDRDEVFLQAVLIAEVELKQTAKAQNLRRQLAQRMIDLGFGTEARNILSDAESVPTPDDRLLFAQSFLTERRPDLAIGYLAGMTSTKANRLRAHAHAMAGQYARAAEAFAETGDTEDMARSIWRSENWQRATDSGTEPERAAAALAIEPELAANDDLGPLARDIALLERSQTTRDRLKELLNATAKP